jgi:hypothetical protein
MRTILKLTLLINMITCMYKLQEICYVGVEKPIPVAARSKSSLCGHSLARIAGSNPTGGMEVCLL